MEPTSQSYAWPNGVGTKVSFEHHLGIGQNMVNLSLPGAQYNSFTETSRPSLTVAEARSLGVWLLRIADVLEASK
jgi:hypothetical protein